MTEHDARCIHASYRVQLGQRSSHATPDTRLSILNTMVILPLLCLLLQRITPTLSLAAVPKGFTGVRFSLYPNVLHDNDEGSKRSLREAIKFAVKDLDTLGLEVLPDDVSTCLLGPEPALFEAMRVAFGRASRSPTGEPRQVSMQCSFSAGCPGEPDSSPLPQRTAVSPNNDNSVAEAREGLPERIACQFAVYPLGTENHMETIYDVIRLAKRSSAWKEGKTHFCSMLDGDGNEVFDVLRSCFDLARESAGHVVMTVSITANKRQWAGKQ